MSEPMSSREIEDVLSSIRRLVADDLRPPREPVPAPDQPQAEDPGTAEAPASPDLASPDLASPDLASPDLASPDPAGAAEQEKGEEDRLILTPSLRVVPQPPVEVTQPDDTWIEEADWQAEPPAPLAWAAQETAAVQIRADEGAHRFTLSAASGLDPDALEPEPEPAALPPLAPVRESRLTSDVLQRLVDEMVMLRAPRQAEEAAQEPAPAGTEPVDEPSVEENLSTDPMGWMAGDGSAETTTIAGAPAEVLVTDVEFIAEAGPVPPEAIVPERDDAADEVLGMPPVVEVAPPAADGGQAAPESPSADREMAPLVFEAANEQAEPASWADRAEAEAIAEIEAIADIATGAEPQADSADGAALEEDSFLFDEALLREIVRDILREELAGPMGEKITRSVRKLVRAEIAQALALRDLT